MNHRATYSPLRPDLGERALEHPDLNVVGDLDQHLAVVLDLGDLADQAAGGDHGVAALDRGNHRLVRLHPLLLRPDDQEIEDTEQQDERYQAVRGMGSFIRCDGLRAPLFGRFSREYSPVAPYCNRTARSQPRNRMNKDFTKAESLLERIAAALERRYGRAGDGALHTGRRRCLRLGSRHRASGAGQGRGRAAAFAAQGHRLRRATCCTRTRSASPTGCRPTTRFCGARAAWARARSIKAVHAEVNKGRAQSEAARAARDPARGHRLPAPSAAAAARRRPALPLVLRRSLLRPRRHELQVAQGGARRRRRGPAVRTCCSTRRRTAAT